MANVKRKIILIVILIFFIIFVGMAKINKNKDLENRRIEGMSYLIEEASFTPLQAAAIMGNLEQESGLNPRAYNTKESALGLAQWRGDRRERFEQYAGEKAKASGGSLENYKYDFRTQLEFVTKELETTEVSTLSAMLDEEDNLPYLVHSFNDLYERSADSKFRKNKGGVFAEARKNRFSYAVDAYNAYTEEHNSRLPQNSRLPGIPTAYEWGKMMGTKSEEEETQKPLPKIGNFERSDYADYLDFDDYTMDSFFEALESDWYASTPNFGYALPPETVEQMQGIPSELFSNTSSTDELTESVNSLINLYKAEKAEKEQEAKEVALSRAAQAGEDRLRKFQRDREMIASLLLNMESAPVELTYTRKYE